MFHVREYSLAASDLVTRHDSEAGRRTGLSGVRPLLSAGRCSLPWRNDRMARAAHDWERGKIMEIGAKTRVADVASEHPATIRVFQKYGIDFCCGGKRPLDEVCREMKLDLAELEKDLGLAVAGPRPDGPPWPAWSIAQIVAGIVARYHRPLDEELARLSQMMHKVLAVHGERHPELAEVSGIFGTLRNELRLHMRKEEEMLFPYLIRIEAAALDPGTLVDPPTGSLAGPIAALEHDHAVVGRSLAELRECTGGYRPPADACNTFRGLYHGFEELERSVHEHVHVENNILFPRAAGIEAELLARAASRR